MRVGMCATAAFAALAAAGPVCAQSSGGAATILGGVPATIQNKPIDTSKLVVAGTMPTQNSFSLTGIFRRITFPGLPTNQGVSNLPSPSSFPTYPNAKMVGTPPYQLGNPQAARFPYLPVIPVLNPVKPITPGSPSGQ